MDFGMEAVGAAKGDRQMDILVWSSMKGTAWSQQPSLDMRDNENTYHVGFQKGQREEMQLMLLTLHHVDVKNGKSWAGWGGTGEGESCLLLSQVNE